MKAKPIRESPKREPVVPVSGTVAVSPRSLKTPYTKTRELGLLRSTAISYVLLVLLSKRPGPPGTVRRAVVPERVPCRAGMCIKSVGVGVGVGAGVGGGVRLSLFESGEIRRRATR